MKEKLFKRRRGSLLLVLTYAALMAMVALGIMQVASSLYTTSRDSARIYSDIQTYRSACEISCYKYVTDLETIVVTKDLSAEWLSVSGPAVYTQALDAIKMELADPSDENKWKVNNILDALAGANISDSSVLTFMLGRLANVDSTFSLTIPEPLKIDWSNPNSWSLSNEAYGYLEPVRIEVRLKVRGEELFEQYDLTDIYLHIQIDEYGHGASKHEIATMALEEKMGGVTITRVVE